MEPPPSARLSGLRLLADSQLEEIHLAALEILRRTGARESLSPGPIDGG